ncbi:hypothetical protein [Roseococcus sp. YIM B11640]|uniref:hypothetical protein n=1 Tax=Roseococcus sp. YIM B11640 TaxID=3133973 RepID=UPI003C7B60CB
MTRPRINWEISIGNILLMCTMVFSATYFVWQLDKKGDSTATAVSNFDGRLTREMAEVRSALEELRRTVNPIGTLNTRVTETERRLTEQDARDNAQDQRLGVMAEAIASLRARVEYVAQPGRRTVP